jgi:FMN reductase
MSDTNQQPNAAERGVTVVVGNPKAKSRTRGVAEKVAAAAAAAAGLPEGTTTAVIELADLGPQLFDWSSAEVRAAADALSASSLAVIATPVYKATYTGLLKSFLDRFPPQGLAGVTAVPLMLGAAPGHALAPELTLRPVLTEIGAIVPVRGLFVLDAAYDGPGAYAPWLARSRSVVTALLDRLPRRTGATA